MMAKPTSSSRRYQKLLDVLDLVFSKSQQKFNVEEAVKVCYGDDGENNKVFQNLLSGVLESVNTEVGEEVREFLKASNVEEKMVKLEAVIAKLEGDAVFKKKAAAIDKKSAVAALRTSKLPDSLQPQDLVNYRAYQRMLQEKNAMESQIADLENEIEQLEKVKNERSTETTAKLGEIHNVGKELEKSADMCSLVS